MRLSKRVDAEILRVVFSSVAMVLMLFASPARADFGNCAAGSTGIDFGSVTISSLHGASSSGTNLVACPGGYGNTNTIAFCTSIGVGSNSISQSNRLMKNGSYSISYQLYNDSAHTQPYTYLGNVVWTSSYSNASGVLAQNNFYGTILSTPANIPPGTYTDSYNSSTQALVNSNGFPTTFSAAENCTGTAAGAYWNTINFTITVVVLPSCSIDNAVLDFGTTSSAITSNIDASTALSVLCTSTTPYSIGLDNGSHANGTQRQMDLASTSNYVTYGLYVDSNRSQSWGTTTSSGSCTAGAGSCYLGTGTGSAQSVPIYGRVPPQTVGAVGTFTDSVVMTVTY